MDREKVIKGLECLAQKQEPMANPCSKCDYHDRPNFAFCVVDVAADALALLKEPDTIRQCAYCKCYAGTHPEFAMCSELDICVDFDFYCKYWTKRI